MALVELTEAKSGESIVVNSRYIGTIKTTYVSNTKASLLMMSGTENQTVEESPEEIQKRIDARWTDIRGRNNDNKKDVESLEWQTN